MPSIHDYDLERFVSAQNPVYETVLSELRQGRKQTHWMWFIFPQIDGLGFSEMAKRYSIKSVDEARDYLTHPILGERLRECAQILTTLEDKSASEIFGSPDDIKFRSSLTLFAYVSKGEGIFVDLIHKYFDGMHDVRTVEILDALAQKHSVAQSVRQLALDFQLSPSPDADMTSSHSRIVVGVIGVALVLFMSYSVVWIHSSLVQGGLLAGQDPGLHRFFVEKAYRAWAFSVFVVMSLLGPLLLALMKVTGTLRR